MRNEAFSASAYRVALRRAAHQIYDSPLIFEDPLALRILGLHGGAKDSNLRAPARASSRSLRAYLVARARFAEDILAKAIGDGATQYVILGAGLDTFAYRNPYPCLRVFEVDHAATQAWKRSLLRQNSIAEPDALTFVESDLREQCLREHLIAAGFDFGAKSVFACLGVVPYISGTDLRVFSTASDNNAIPPG